MIWPLTSLSAGQMLIVSIVLFGVLLEVVLKKVWKTMNNSSEKTVLRVIEEDDKDELDSMLKAVDAELPNIGRIAIVPLALFIIAVLYTLGKMFICSCACNNCP